MDVRFALAAVVLTLSCSGFADIIDCRDEVGTSFSMDTDKLQAYLIRDAELSLMNCNFDNNSWQCISETWPALEGYTVDIELDSQNYFQPYKASISKYQGRSSTFQAELSCMHRGA